MTIERATGGKEDTAAAAAAAQRAQTTVRIDRRVLKASKGLAQYLDIEFDQLVERALLDVLRGESGLGRDFRSQTATLATLYGLPESVPYGATDGS
jgi:hypothetical protein